MGNIYTRQVMELLSVDESTAEDVIDQMDIRFSECSDAEFNECARETYQDIQDYPTLRNRTA